eukprot:TRINITY_DN1168_c0_g1_i1.p1 TRINITY_DN1168_c0_g1~~TRINITY_DN1168_c0_g1_i1.p1  ORF type:complete len:878 (-),score=201.52 TRINITY_DN1168_c0_g1_i1:85-2595(-)
MPRPTAPLRPSSAPPASAAAAKRPRLYLDPTATPTPAQPRDRRPPQPSSSSVAPMSDESLVASVLPQKRKKCPREVQAVLHAVDRPRGVVRSITPATLDDVPQVRRLLAALKARSHGLLLEDVEQELQVLRRRFVQRQRRTPSLAAAPAPGSVLSAAGLAAPSAVPRAPAPAVAPSCAPQSPLMSPGDRAAHHPQPVCFGASLFGLSALSASGRGSAGGGSARTRRWQRPASTPPLPAKLLLSRMASARGSDLAAGDARLAAQPPLALAAASIGEEAGYRSCGAAITLAVAPLSSRSRSCRRGRRGRSPIAATALAGQHGCCGRTLTPLFGATSDSAGDVLPRKRRKVLAAATVALQPTLPPTPRPSRSSMQPTSPTAAVTPTRLLPPGGCAEVVTDCSPSPQLNSEASPELFGSWSSSPSKCASEELGSPLSGTLHSPSPQASARSDRSERQPSEDAREMPEPAPVTPEPSELRKALSLVSPPPAPPTTAVETSIAARRMTTLSAGNGAPAVDEAASVAGETGHAPREGFAPSKGRQPRIDGARPLPRPGLRGAAAGDFSALAPRRLWRSRTRGASLSPPRRDDADVAGRPAASAATAAARARPRARSAPPQLFSPVPTLASGRGEENEDGHGGDRGDCGTARPSRHSSTHKEQAAWRLPLPMGIKLNLDLSPADGAAAAAPSAADAAAAIARDGGNATCVGSGGCEAGTVAQAIPAWVEKEICEALAAMDRSKATLLAFLNGARCGARNGGNGGGAEDILRSTEVAPACESGALGSRSAEGGHAGGGAVSNGRNAEGGSAVISTRSAQLRRCASAPAAAETADEVRALFTRAGA